MYAGVVSRISQRDLQILNQIYSPAEATMHRQKLCLWLWVCISCVVVALHLYIAFFVPTDLEPYTDAHG